MIHQSIYLDPRVKKLQWTHHVKVKVNDVLMLILAMPNFPLSYFIFIFSLHISERSFLCYMRKVFDGLWAPSPLSPLYHHIPLKLGQHHQKTCQWQTKWGGSKHHFLSLISTYSFAICNLSNLHVMRRSTFLNCGWPTPLPALHW